MRTKVVSIADDATPAEALRQLTQARASGAPVTDPAGRIVGVLSLRDLADHLTEEGPAGLGAPDYYRAAFEDWSDEDAIDFDSVGRAPDAAAVRDLMSPEVISVPAEAGLQEVARTMHERGVHRVLEESRHRFVGLISTLDILEALAA
jgi:CBS domain-containing protein